MIPHEALWRMGIFFGVVAVMILWEVSAPRLSSYKRWSKRQLNNFLLLSVDILIMRLIFPASAVGVAWWAQENGYGILNVVAWNEWLELLIVMLFFDFAIYWQHVFFHHWPWLWRLHRLHHSDKTFDYSLSIRFHPLEILISMLYKSVLIILVGASPLSMLVFEVVLNAMALFNHGNINIKGKLDHALRWVIVTPDMHRIHHSVYPKETNSNYSFNLSIWDRLFGSYTKSPRDTHEKMNIGLEYFRSDNESKLWPMLTQPFRSNEDNEESIQS